MKKILGTPLAIVLLLSLVFTSTSIAISRKKQVEEDIRRVEAMSRRFSQIKKSMTDRGYLKVDELKELLKHELRKGENSWWYSTTITTMCIKRTGWTPTEVYDTLAIAISRDYLPFKVMMYRAIEKENFDEAENVRMIWIDYLEEILAFLEYYIYYVDTKTGKPIGLREYCYLKKSDIWGKKQRLLAVYLGTMGHTLTPPNAERLAEKVRQQIQKLTSVVGLTDPMLTRLRKELMVTIEEKKWDDAQKIQNLINARINELRPPQPQIVYKELPSKGGDTTVIFQQSSEQTVTHKKSHGAEDWLRAGSLLTGKGYSRKELGAAKAIDMIFGW